MSSILIETDHNYWAILILIAATIFTIFWGLDAKTHKKLVEIDITDKELQTHRNILTASLIMEVSLVMMFWFPLAMLPIFIASFLTRFVHEFIDELHFHSDRCSPYESMLHLGMWVSVLTKIAAMFIWGFFLQYEGIWNLPVYFYPWAIILFMSMTYISYVEWKR
jgi:hypothetical protein